MLAFPLGKQPPLGPAGGVVDGEEFVGSQSWVLALGLELHLSQHLLS